MEEQCCYLHLIKPTSKLIRPTQLLLEDSI